MSIMVAEYHSTNIVNLCSKDIKRYKQINGTPNAHGNTHKTHIKSKGDGNHRPKRSKEQSNDQAKKPQPRG